MKIKHKFPLRQLLILFIITVILQLISVVILLLPQVDGSFFDSQISYSEPRHFDTFSYSATAETHISFLDGGYVVPIFVQETPYALAFFGDGQIIRGSAAETLPECIFLLSEQHYTAIMGGMELQTSSEDILKIKAEKMLIQVIDQSPVIYTLIGPQYFKLETSEPSIFLTAAEQASLITLQHTPLFENTNYLLSLLSLVFQYAALLGLIIIITNTRRERPKLHDTLQPALTAVRWKILAVAAVSIALPFLIENPYVSFGFYFFALVYSCYLIFYKCHVKAVDIHLDVKFYNRSILVALVTGILIYAGITLSFPRAISATSDWLYPITASIAITSWLCFFGFSYLHYDLTAKLKPRNAYLVIAALALSGLAVGLYFKGLTIAMILINTLVFGLLNTAILTVLAIRTKHALIPATAWSIALIIHQILIL